MSNGIVISNDSSVKPYTTMKSDITIGIEKKQEFAYSHQNVRKRKNYYAKLLEMLVRKTDSERRAEVFGFDPFK